MIVHHSSFIIHHSPLLARASWLPQWVNMLSWWQWLILGAVPPAIVLLYFLKLKRRPVEVPSTYLWQRSIEDLHVNTIWQRLRRNLLLFLQLLLVFLAMLAVLRPGWRGAKLSGDRFIFLIDNSASMQANDMGASRLEEAKRRAAALIDEMGFRDAGMVVSFSDAARIEEMFTRNRRRLRRSVEAIQPTQRTTSLAEALKVAAGLANPGRSGEDATDVQAAEAMPATLYIFSDGKFAGVSDFRLGNLDPVYVPVGSPEAANVGILAFSVGRHVANPDMWQAFARLANFGSRPASVSLELKLNGQLADADRLDIPAGQTQRVAFDLSAVTSGVLELRVIGGGHLKCDDVAWAVVNAPRRSKVLVVTPGNEFLKLAFNTASVQELAEVKFETPAFLAQPEYQQQAAAGGYELVIYDRCQPKEMPQANTLFIGALPRVRREGDQAAPSGEASPPEQARKIAASPKEGPEQKKADEARPRGASLWRAAPEVPRPVVIIDIDSTHPLMQWIEMGDVEIDHPRPLEVPPGGSPLVDVQWVGDDGRSHVGTVLAVAPREGFEDAVMGFVLVDQRAAADGSAQTFIGTNWPIKQSFPVFVLNLLYYLGGTRAAGDGAAVKPGQPIELESPTPGIPLEVRTPGGKTHRLQETRPGKFQFTGTSELGVYEVLAGGKTRQRFAVNLFDAPESDIRPSPQIQIGRGTPVEGQATSAEPSRRELWKWLLLGGLGVLLIEWYVYNRRVYL